MSEILHLKQYPDGVRQASVDDQRLAYLNKWLEMFRPFAYATQDNTWGELEKILDIVHRNYVQMARQEMIQKLARVKKEQAEVLKELRDFDDLMDGYGYKAEDEA